MKKSIILFCLFAGLLFIGWSQQKPAKTAEQWGVFQIDLKAAPVGNPYTDTELNAIFSKGKNSIKVPGFYDGNGIFIIRFSPDEQGEWSYKTESNVKKLSGKKGKFNCVPPSGNNHGPLKIVNTFYVQYTDGTPFYSIGTTAYQWTSVKQSIQEKTLKTLATAPFNKIRMCFFPKNYRFGNDTEPWMYPFKRENGQNDFSQPNYEFFQNFDKRVEQLMEMGIQADVILFHPYDIWGYCNMGDKMNERYVRYMIARISAYRNVRWSLANEWDEPKIKKTINWEEIGTLLQNEDPHHRFRGIHNWYGSEDHFYDHTRPWITHVSMQTGQFYNAIKWRNQYNKPVFFDEMSYEGDVPAGWGNKSGKEMTSRFWMVGLSGGYGTHGETFKNDSDNETEVRWWAKGGTLMGESPVRIAFFKKIMEEAPVTEMAPEQINTGGPANSIKNIYIFSKKGEYYLAYAADSAQTIKINLPGEKNYDLQVIDTWNMKIVSEKTIGPGSFNYETEMPFTTLRLTRTTK
jgi:hypothetical protein